MTGVVGAALSMVSKALAPVSDGLLEVWAASKELGPNVDALKMELLYVQGVLNNTRGREIDNPALNELLQKLRQLAYGAEDVLDELDYFRIQDGLYGTYEAADEHAKGCVCNLFFNVHHTAKAVGKLLGCSCTANPRDPDESRPEEDARQRVRCCAWPCAKRSARGNTSSVPNTNQADEEVSGCIHKLASGALNTVRTVGKLLPCSSSPPVHDDVSGKSVLCGACIRKAPQRKHAKEAPKLEFDRVDLSKRMKHIVEQLQPLCAKVSTILNLELLGSNRTTTPSIEKGRLTTTSDIIEPKLYGRDETMKKIICSITKDEYSNKDLTILPVVGPGGIGKTTLIQHIYNNQEVQKHFQVKVWICVSNNFNVNKLIEEIEKAIPSVEGEKKGRVEELIKQRLHSKRFLFILDDIWKCESEDWKRLLVPLTKEQAKGNIIVVTTRFPAVAEMVKTTDSSINLEGLDQEMFRDFFRACIFGEGQSVEAHDGLLETGDKIAKKLKGSPLAAKTVGRLLRNDLALYHWRRVLESREWEMLTGESDIMPALKLSYDYLPFHLQQCFSCCALFPEDYKFDSEELIHFSIGLDILHIGGRYKTVEGVGLSSLNDLVKHGFFIKDETDGRPYYIIHDLLRDLALKVASHEYLSLHRSNVRSVEIQPSVRHLSIIIDGQDDGNVVTDENFKSELTKLMARLKVENLQTLLIFGKLDENFVNIFGDLFKEANALRILCLPTISCPMESMFHNFSALLHLRYLRLGTSVSEMHLPKTFSRFYHLRILDLKAWRGCRDLPRDMSNLAKLCHFLTQHDELHSSIYNVGKLKLLQELKAFAAKKESEGFEPNQLEHLLKLRELGIYNLEKIHTKEEAAEVKLRDKKYLHRLTLDWDSERSNTDPEVEAVVLESLEPHRNIQELCIRGHRGRTCPTRLGDKLTVVALQHLHLVGVSWEVFPSLGKMSDLRELALNRIATIKEFVVEESFCNLIKLTLVGLVSFEKWIPGTHLFPLLQVLIIRNCPNLLKLPFSNHSCDTQKQEWNTDWCPSLQVLEIVDCEGVLSLPLIPWTGTLCSVKIRDVGSRVLDRLVYSKASFGVELDITGKGDLHSLDQVLVFNKLKELQEFTIRKCPPLELKHLLMLTALRNLSAESSNALVGPSGDHGDVEWWHPVEHIEIISCDVSGKELTQLISHLPMLSKLKIKSCKNIKQLVVGVDLQQTTPPASPSTSLAAKDDQQEIAEEVEEDDGLVGEEEQAAEKEDGLLLIPTHLSDSLQGLTIKNCSELSLMASPTLPDGHNNEIGGRGGEGGGLQALHSLQELKIWDCPEFLSVYKTSSVCPFPSSLRDLSLYNVESMETFEPLSNLTSLTELCIVNCGEDLRWPLHTQGQLSYLSVYESPNFFAGRDPMRGPQDEQERQLVSGSFKLRQLDTDDVAGVLVVPICSLLSSSLTQLAFGFNNEVVRFRKEQEEALHLLTSLQELQFEWCNKLQHLPAGLNKLTNLKALQICYCPSLRSLPKDGLPSSLQELDVLYCNNKELKQKCRQLTGTIPKIRLEYGRRLIQGFF